MTIHYPLVWHELSAQPGFKDVTEHLVLVSDNMHRGVKIDAQRTAVGIYATIERCNTPKAREDARSLWSGTMAAQGGQNLRMPPRVFSSSEDLEEFLHTPVKREPGITGAAHSAVDLFPDVFESDEWLFLAGFTGAGLKLNDRPVVLDPAAYAHHPYFGVF